MGDWCAHGGLHAKARSGSGRSRGPPHNVVITTLIYLIRPLGWAKPSPTTIEMSTTHYFNHAGCSIITERTKHAMVAQLDRETRVGCFTADQMSAAEMQKLYELAASAIGAAASDITLTDSHTTGWAKALQALDIKSGDVLLTTRSEWGGNLKFMQNLAHRVGAQVKVVPSDDRGATSVESLVSLMTPQVKLISVAWLGSNGAHLEPAQTIGAIARSHGVPYFLDASQVVGQLRVDVAALGCDMLSTPGRKWLRGPKGTGLMYLRPSFLAKVQAAGAFEGMLEPGASLTARHFEAPSTSRPLHMGLKTALEQFHEVGVEDVRRRILANTCIIWERLKSIPQLRFLHDQSPEHGLLSFTIHGHTAAAVKTHFMARGVEVAANEAAFTPLDMGTRGLQAVVRVSPHTDTTPEAIDGLVNATYMLCGRT
jgi:cysteine desulfurase / selenocysteine lyase